MRNIASVRKPNVEMLLDSCFGRGLSLRGTLGRKGRGFEALGAFLADCGEGRIGWRSLAL